MNKAGKVADLEEIITDEELVEQALAGRGEVFAHLYERYYSRAYRLAYGMTGQHEAAEDLTQEIFMRTYQKLDQYGGQASFATWFYRLAVNRCLNYRKQEKRLSSEDARDIEMLPLPGAARQMEKNIFQKQAQAHIHRALLSLKPGVRMIVILKDIEGLSYEEIAERADCSKGTIASRLNRGRRLLARKLAHLRGAF